MKIYYVTIGSFKGYIPASSGHIALIKACRKIPSLKMVYTSYKKGISIRKCKKMFFHLHGGIGHVKLLVPGVHYVPKMSIVR